MSRPAIDAPTMEELQDSVSRLVIDVAASSRVRGRSPSCEWLKDAREALEDTGISKCPPGEGSCLRGKDDSDEGGSEDSSMTASIEARIGGASDGSTVDQDSSPAVQCLGGLAFPHTPGWFVGATLPDDDNGDVQAQGNRTWRASRESHSLYNHDGVSEDGEDCSDEELEVDGGRALLITVMGIRGIKLNKSGEPVFDDYTSDEE